MQNKQFIEDMGLLAELSYVDFSNESLSKNNINWKDNAIDDIKSDENDVDTERETLLVDLLDTYEIGK
jgi:hypothetical protein